MTFIYIICKMGYIALMKFEYILLIILIIISIINFYYFFYGRRIKNKNNKYYQELQLKLENKYSKYIKKNNITPLYKNLIVSDDNKGFIVLISNQLSKIIFIEEKAINQIDFKEIKKIDKIIEQDKKNLIKAEILIQTNDNVYIYKFGTKKRKLNSILAKFIIDNCNSTYSSIEELLNK